MFNRSPCTHPDCGKRSLANQLCERHYSIAYYRGDFNKINMTDYVRDDYDKSTDYIKHRDKIKQKKLISQPVL